MKFFKSKKLIIPALIVLILIAVGVLITASFGTDFWSQDLKVRFLGTFSNNPFRKQSQVNVSLVDSKLNLNFELIPEDELRFASFIRNWFGIDERVKTVSFGIDENMTNALKANLPVNLKLIVDERSLGFNSNIVSGLKNPLINSDVEFATGSSKMNAQVTDSSRYQIKLENPEDLVNYATSSGMLTTSSKIEGLFKSLSKVATIELNVNGKNISGKIVLK